MNDRRRLERETDDEILIHLAHRVDALVARGMSRQHAEEEAMRRFGPLHTGRAEMLAAARHRDRVLTMHDHLDSFLHDATYALRQIRRAPGLAAVIIVTFALGVGANATMFGLIDRLLFRPPAHVAAPEQLVRVQMRMRFPGREEFTSSSFSYPAYAAVRDNVAAFASVAMQTFPNPISFGLGAAAHPIQHLLVSGNYFSTLGTRMALGRSILPADDVPPNGSPVAVIGYGLWQRELGGNREVLGTTISLAGRKFTIVGIAPADFVGVGRRPIDVWIPIAASEGIRFAGADWATNRTVQWMSVVARLNPGARPELAGEQVAAALRAANSAATGKPDTTTFPISAASILPNKTTKLSADSRVAVLLGSVSVLVVLIACANVANLLLARALGRRREIAVRLALGISRVRLMRQLLLEGVALAILGGAASLIVVQYGGVFIYRALLADSARPASFVDLRVFSFTTVATLLVGIVTAMVPAVQASSPNLTSDLKEGTRGAGVSHSRTRVALLVAQAALSVVLLAGTGAFVSSLRKVTTVSLGLDIDRIVYGRIDLRSVGIDSARSLAYFNDAVAAARRLPGVESVAIAEAGPFTDWSMGIGLKIPGRDSVPEFEQGPFRHGVSEDYFRTVRTRIIRGREFTRSDFSNAAEPVIIINADGARRLWPNEEAVGKCIALAEKDAPCARIVGVAEDTHRSEVVEKGARMQVYNPLGHSIRTEPRAFTLLVRTSGDPAAIVDPLRRMMQTVQSGLPYAEVKPMAAMLDRELRPWRLGATLFGVFGAIALVLSALGLYSVVSYSVTQRTHEMGVRVALGAQVADIVRLVLTQGMGVATIGVLIGAGLTLGGAGLVKPLLYETSARDPLVLVAVAGVLLSVAAMASLIPARRATRADPLSALRAE
jgi:predicted permease